MLKLNTHALISRYSTLQWCLIAIVLFILSKVTQIFWLDPLYVKSQFPVNFFVGQTTFNALQLKSYYAILVELGTLNKYLIVQLADYVFMLTVFISHLSLMIAAYKILPNINLLKKITWAMIFISPMAAGFDALENIVSFFMIANPLNFSNWLVYPYSSFASIKFIIFAITYLWALLAIIIKIIDIIYQVIHSFLNRKKINVI